VNTFTGLRNGCLIRLMVDCGCRQGEALSARARDIVWPRNEIVITGKTGTRSVKFSDETAAWLDRYARERNKWAREEVECLIVSERGQALGPNGLYSLFARLRRSVRIPRLHAHLLRHTWATNFRRFDCGDLLDLQERGGWADLGMVRRYAHIRPDSERQRERSPLDMLRAANTQAKVPNYRGKSDVQQRLNKLFTKRRRRVA
jgi:integrase/recombinase XerC/integrase/recombinase XerD